MNENRRQILEMLAAGKITADEAERLLAALEPGYTLPAGITGQSPVERIWHDHRQDPRQSTARIRRGRRKR